MRYLLLAVTIHIGCRRGHSLAFTHRNSWNQIRIAGRRRGMKHISKLSVSMVAFVLLTAACGTEVSSSGTDRLPDDDQASGADDSPSLDGDWLLIDATIDGEALALDPDYDITLLIMASQVSGRAACNGYGGTAFIDGTAFSIGDVGQTEMGCEPSVMDLEASYVAALGRVTTAHRTARALTLTGEHVDLVFETIAPRSHRRAGGHRMAPRQHHRGRGGQLDQLICGSKRPLSSMPTAPSLEPRDVATSQASTLLQEDRCSSRLGVPRASARLRW